MFLDLIFLASISIHNVKHIPKGNLTVVSNVSSKQARKHSSKNRNIQKDFSTRKENEEMTTDITTTAKVKHSNY